MSESDRTLASDATTSTASPATAGAPRSRIDVGGTYRHASDPSSARSARSIGVLPLRLGPNADHHEIVGGRDRGEHVITGVDAPSLGAIAHGVGGDLPVVCADDREVAGDEHAGVADVRKGRLPHALSALQIHGDECGYTRRGGARRRCDG